MNIHIIIGLGLLIVFLIGVITGAYISIKSIEKNSVKPMVVFVDESYVNTKKRTKQKKKIRNKDIEDDDEMFLLGGRIKDDMSLTEKECISKGIDITEVVKENQTDVDNAFEYLALDTQDDLDTEDIIDDNLFENLERDLEEMLEE